MRKGYLVVYTAYEYNDEYYSSLEGDPLHITLRVFATREAARAHADVINFQHAGEVVRDLHAWFYGEGFSSAVAQLDEEVAEELHRRVYPGKEVPRDIERAFEDVRELELGDEDLRWFAKNVCPTYARVEDVDVEE